MKVVKVLVCLLVLTGGFFTLACESELDYEIERQRKCSDCYDVDRLFSLAGDSPTRLWQLYRSSRRDGEVSNVTIGKLIELNGGDDAAKLVVYRELQQQDLYTPNSLLESFPVEQAKHLDKQEFEELFDFLLDRVAAFGDSQSKMADTLFALAGDSTDQIWVILRSFRFEENLINRAINVLVEKNGGDDAARQTVYREMRQRDIYTPSWLIETIEPGTLDDVLLRARRQIKVSDSALCQIESVGSSTVDQIVDWATVMSYLDRPKAQCVIDKIDQNIATLALTDSSDAAAFVGSCWLNDVCQGQNMTVVHQKLDEFFVQADCKSTLYILPERGLLPKKVTDQAFQRFTQVDCKADDLEDILRTRVSDEIRSRVDQAVLAKLLQQKDHLPPEVLLWDWYDRTVDQRLISKLLSQGVKREELFELVSQSWQNVTTAIRLARTFEDWESIAQVDDETPRRIAVKKMATLAKTYSQWESVAEAISGSDVPAMRQIYDRAAAEMERLYLRR